jgi:hypothetical protein
MNLFSLQLFKLTYKYEIPYMTSMNFFSCSAASIQVSYVFCRVCGVGVMWVVFVVPVRGVCISEWTNRTFNFHIRELFLSFKFFCLQLQCPLLKLHSISCRKKRYASITSTILFLPSNLL